MCKWTALKYTVLSPKTSIFLVNFCNSFLFVKNLLKFKLNQLKKLYLFCMKEVEKLQANEEGIFLFCLCSCAVGSNHKK